MEKQTCSSCQKPVAGLTCGLCTEPICKACARLIEVDHFSFLKTVPDELLKETYCGPCYNATVAPVEETYDATMERAKEVFIYMKSQSKETRLIKRKVPAVKVANCLDEEEALMRMAFVAAEAGCNALIDVDLTYKKVKMSGYQTTHWDGYAIPARVAATSVGEDRVVLRNPN